MANKGRAGFFIDISNMNEIAILIPVDIRQCKKIMKCSVYVSLRIILKLPYSPMTFPFFSLWFLEFMTAICHFVSLISIIWTSVVTIKILTVKAAMYKSAKHLVTFIVNNAAQLACITNRIDSKMVSNQASSQTHKRVLKHQTVIIYWKVLFCLKDYTVSSYE